MVGFPWNNSELVKHEYEQDNFKIIHTGAKSKRAIIFFSGNGLYYPNTIEEFTEKIIKKDRYEWQNISSNKKICEYYELIIFCRDLYKQYWL